MAVFSLHGGTILVDLRGDVQLVEALKGLPLKVEKKVIRAAVEQANRSIFRSVVAEVPVAAEPIKRKGFIQEPGFLKARIVSMASKFNRFGGRISSLTILPRRAALNIAPTDKNYWPFALLRGYRIARSEARTKARQAKGEHTAGMVAARPYLTEGFEKVAPAVANQLMMKIQEGVIREWERL